LKDIDTENSEKVAKNVTLISEVTEKPLSEPAGMCDGPNGLVHERLSAGPVHQIFKGSTLMQDLTEQEKSLIREKIQEKYDRVAASPAGCFRYPTGKEGISALGYPPELWEDFPESLLASFCGVGNPFSLRPIQAGEAVLDIGCGAGFDAFIAGRLVGPQGRVVGIDVTPRMVEKAKEHLGGLLLEQVAFQMGEAEALPFPDKDFDVVLSNGVLNLTMDKEKAVREIFRVLKPGGRALLADMVLVEALPPERDRKIDNWYQ
jgi:arsenite methyltransferase